MSLEAYRNLGICVGSDDKSTSSASTVAGDSEEVVHFTHKGFKDVTVIKTPTPFGTEEELGPTSEYLPPAPKANKRALRKFDRFSVLVRRVIKRYGDRDILAGTELCIQSPTLCDIFRSIVVDTHASFDITSTPIVMPAPFYELFFRRKEIEAYVNGNEKEESRAEVKLLHNFFRNDKLTIDNIAAYESMIAQGKVNTKTLWTLYPPNELLFVNTGEDPECWLCRDVQLDPKDPTLWWVTGARLDFNGRELGLTNRRCGISFAGRVDGSMDISELPLVPKRYFDRAAQVTDEIVKRGQTYRDIMGGELNGHAYRHYKGPVWSNDRVNVSARGVANERVVVDYKAFLDSSPSEASSLENLGKGSPSSGSDSDSDSSSAKSSGADDGEKDAFAALLGKIPKKHGVKTMEDLLLLSPPRMPAYGLKSKQWGWVLIENLTPVEASEVPFRSLQADPSTKSLVRSLVVGHQNGGLDNDFDDVVRNKAKGLVMMLHGKPGIGKTLTAESIAELNGSPLYSVSGGELSVDVSKVEEKLTSVFELGKRWKAIILLDEADVVMTKRSSSELERNAIVAVWLRMLEYFEGILFLTTNRQDQFDEAFQSRIHLTIKLPDLGPKERQGIWEALVHFNGKVTDETSWTPQMFEILGKLEVNGRLIKNLLRTATYHARSTKRDNPLRPSHLCEVIKVELSNHKNIEEVLSELEMLIAQPKPGVKQVNGMPKMSETQSALTLA
ncbi:ATPase-AAA-core domain-containing protein [Fusarium sp. Ph1]|nr:ATPase-AAA-core domain-containing protein [Fusarium sp. Ph1]